jgi:DNA-binding PadR family transcriptional regulator
MPAGVVNLNFFILGLLAQKPMSGYDIKRFMKSLGWLIGSPSGGSLYPVLRALLQEDLVTVKVIPGLDKPPRKIYSITDAGRQALQSWTEQPVVASTSLKAFVMRLLLADSHTKAGLLAHLQQRRAQVAAHHATLVKGAGNLDEGSSLGQRVALDYGMALARAELDWLDSTWERFSAQPLRKEDDHSDGEASGV